MLLNKTWFPLYRSAHCLWLVLSVIKQNLLLCQHWCNGFLNKAWPLANHDICYLWFVLFLLIARLLITYLSINFTFLFFDTIYSLSCLCLFVDLLVSLFIIFQGYFKDTHCQTFWLIYQQRLECFIEMSLLNVKNVTTWHQNTYKLYRFCRYVVNSCSHNCWFLHIWRLYSCIGWITVRV